MSSTTAPSPGARTEAATRNLNAWIVVACVEALIVFVCAATIAFAAWVLGERWNFGLLLVLVAAFEALRRLRPAMTLDEMFDRARRWIAEGERTEQLLRELAAEESEKQQEPVAAEKTAAELADELLWPLAAAGRPGTASPTPAQATEVPATDAADILHEDDSRPGRHRA